jgi:5'-methylthioinosine phosphorylase
MTGITTLAIIGGSGSGLPSGFRAQRLERPATRWGEPSAAIHVGMLAELPALYLARHGEPHLLAPHRINYRANIQALQDLAATHVIAINAVGGIGPDALTGSLCVPDQIIDYTWGRESSFFDGSVLALDHIEFAAPYDAWLSQQLCDAAAAAGIALRNGGVYGCTQGPRLETAAEIRRMQRDGCDLVGMTAMPEAVLARELGLPYACMAMVVNRAAGLSPEPITLEQIHREAARCREHIEQILQRLAQSC